MKPVSLILLASGVSAAVDLADMFLHPEVNDGNQVEARQIIGDDVDDVDVPGPSVTITKTECLFALNSLATDAPVVPAEFITRMDDDFCISDLPSSLSSESKSFFESDWASYTRENKDAIKTAKDECPDITSEIDLLMSMCQETGSSNSDDDEDAAPRLTGALLAAVLAAGGAVMATI